MRAWYNGRIEASQALDPGSIPGARIFFFTSVLNSQKEKAHHTYFIYLINSSSIHLII